MNSSWRRSLVKALTYRAFTVPFETAILSILFSYSGFEIITAIKSAFAFTIFTEATHVVYYVVHERAWDRTNWGRSSLDYTKDEYRKWLFFRLNRTKKWKRWYWKFRWRFCI